MLQEVVGEAEDPHYICVFYRRRACGSELRQPLLACALLLLGREQRDVVLFQYVGQQRHVPARRAASSRLANGVRGQEPARH